jgi:probable O-glycosylation ligase (exosortase A-associated)
VGIPRAASRGWDLLLVCLAGYEMTVVGRVHQLFGFLEPLHLTLLSAGLAIALYAHAGGRERRLTYALRLRTTRIVLALTVWMVLSIPSALWPGGAFHLLTDEFLKSIVLFVVLVGAVRDVGDVERLAFAYLLSVGVYATVVLSRFHLGAGDQWRLGSLYYYDANEFATLAVMSLPLGVYFVVRQGRLWQRLVCAATVVVLAVGIIWAGSRGGFLALIAVGGFLLLRYQAIRVGWRVVTTALLAMIFAATATDKYWASMRTILAPQGDYNVTDEAGRVQVWKRGMGYMLQHPVLGVGAGNFPTAEGTISPLIKARPVGRGVKWSVAHNSFLQVGAELGVPGLLLFVWMLCSAFAALVMVQHSSRPVLPAERRPPSAQLAQTFAAALIGYAVGGFFLSLAYADMLIVLLALVVGLSKVTRLNLPIPGRVA